MVRTRAQANKTQEQSSEENEDIVKVEAGTKRSQPDDTDYIEEDAGGEADEAGEDAAEPPPTKAAKHEDGQDIGAEHVDAQENGANHEKSIKGNATLDKLLSSYGAFPLQDVGLPDPEKPTAETMLAHVFNALLTSTRISHQIAAKTLRQVIEAGYANLATLEKSTWEERTQVLTDGGYTHYRERTATELGDLAQWLRENYDGDLNNLLQQAKEENQGSGARDAVREAISKIKGIGNVALDIFCDTAQGLWPELAPFLDPRSQATAEKIGVPSDVEELYKLAGRDPGEMCKVAAALTTVRLGSLENEFRSS